MIPNWPQGIFSVDKRFKIHQIVTVSKEIASTGPTLTLMQQMTPGQCKVSKRIQMAAVIGQSIQEDGCEDG